MMIFFDLHIFYVIDNLKVDVKMPQIMCCVLCYNNVVDPSIFNQWTRLRISPIGCNHANRN